MMNVNVENRNILVFYRYLLGLDTQLETGTVPDKRGCLVTLSTLNTFSNTTDE